MNFPDPSLHATMFGKGVMSSPFFTATNQFLPKTLKEVMLWADYIIANSPLIAEVVRKHASFPITDFTYSTDDEEIRTKYEDLFEHMALRHNLCTIGFDYNTKGNVFISLYFPFNRMAICKNCGTAHNATKSANVKFKTQQGFFGTCSHCGHTGVYTIKDEFIKDPSRINVVTWDPFYISVNHNPISNESEYYYQIPPRVKRAVNLGDPLFTGTLPLGMLEAIKKNVEFKFDSKHIFHFKNSSIGRMDDGMAMPPIMSLFHLVFHQAMLRKANEAIAAEHMTPMRVLFPQSGNSGAADALVHLSTKTFSDQVTDQIKRFKQDPNHVMIAPMPVGYQAIGGDGKALLVGQEMELTEETILMALGVSRELLSGTTNWTSSTIGLRLMANSMENYLRQVRSVIKWITIRVAEFLGYERITVDLVPFQLADDDFVRQGLPQLAQAEWMSPTSLSSAFGFDFDKELEQRMKDMVAMAKFQVKVKEATMKAATEAATSTNTSEQDHLTGYNDLKAKAFDSFMEINSLDPESQKIALSNLEQEDSALYEMVASLLGRFNDPRQQVTAPPEEEEEAPAPAKKKPAKGDDK